MVRRQGLLPRAREWVRQAVGLATYDELAAAQRELRISNLRLASARGRLTDSPITGVPFVGGPEGGQFTYETNQVLRGAQRWDVLSKMQTDPHVEGALRGVALPLMAAEWTVKPASDKPEDEDVADFVAAVLLRKPSDKWGREYWTGTPWRGQRLPEILDCLASGFAMFGKVWRVAEGKGGAKQVYDRLVWLEPSSVDPRGWKLEGNELAGVKRTYRDPAGQFHMLEFLAAEDLALYPWSLKGSRLEGTPFIRSMYGSWFRKDFLQRQAMIWAQKVGAPAPFGTYPASWDDAEVAKFTAFLQQMRGTAPIESYGAFASSADGVEPKVGYAGLAGAQNVDRMRSLIDGENAEIAHGGGTKSQLAGETATGSRAVAGTQQNMELLLVQAVGEVVCEFETHGAGNLKGVIEDLVDRNFPDVSDYPCLEVSKVEPNADLATLDQLIKAKAAGLVPDHPEIRKQVTERLGYTLPDDAYEVQQLAPAVGPDGKPLPGQPAGPSPGGTPGNGSGPGAGEEKGAGTVAPGDRGAAPSSGYGRRLGMRLALKDMLAAWPQTPEDKAKAASSGYGRKPTAFEGAVCSLGGVVSALDASASSTAAALKGCWSAMIDDVLLRVKSGKVTQGTLDSLRRSKPKGEQALKLKVREQFTATSVRGRTQAKDELKRQKGLGAKAVGLARVDLQELPPGAKPPKGAKSPMEGVDVQVLYDELGEEARVTASIAVDDLWGRLTMEAAGEYQRLTREGVTGDALWAQLEAHLRDLSTGPMDAAGKRISNVAYNEGRDLAGKEAAAAGDAVWAMRSEVLDSATCSRCAALDGVMAIIGTDDYDRLMPPAQCLGDENCRGFIIPLDSEVTNAMADEGDGGD